jgi:hypothetical protein
MSRRVLRAKEVRFDEIVRLLPPCRFAIAVWLRFTKMVKRVTKMVMHC